jgi:hypothetical protein
VDVQVKRGVEIGSYHHLVLMRMDEGRMGVKGKKSGIGTGCALKN